MPGVGCEISVIVRCKNEERWIGHCIQSVIDVLDNPEVVVVENNSTDESMDVCRMFEHHVDLKYVFVDQYSPGLALNRGVEQCSYDHILVFSAHCELVALDVSALKELVNTHAGVFGKQTPVYRGRRIGKRYIWSHFTDEPALNMYSEIEKRYFMHNAFAGYHKSTLLSNKFDEELYGKEDRYWAAKMINEGHSTYYDPSMQCLHHWTGAGATWKGIG